MTKEFKKLKAYRQLKGINQSAMADLIGVSLNTYNFKENGKKQFTLQEAKSISDYFGVTIDEIFFNDSVNIKLTNTA
ncbi:helix-turn-helix transcriptional regulator [Clostridium niameyense]|uniref:Helix-turn-helix transcriptional regulator n=1 Tax=Clostridium niameyense TaxID=1622073 RepID=A0A6M0R8V9_9CLOT|nr:helix-turn-helix transcriptional regulator [Clostridium niameyense]NEZ46120.1 helix-turn-helix transcriptional regulator [Clostridium niameyense]